MDGSLAHSARDALRHGRGILSVAFVLSFFVNILRLAGPMFIILIYDRVLPSRSEETLVVLFAMVVMFLVAQAVIDYARRRILARFGAQFQERMEGVLFAHAGQSQLLDRAGAKPVAGLDEVDGLRGFFHSASLVAIHDFVWAPMFLLVVFVLNPLLGWVCMGGMVMLLALVVIRMGFIGTRASAALAAGRDMADLRTMIAASRDTIRSQDMRRGFTDRWMQVRRTCRDRAIALKDWTVWFDSLSDACVLLARYAVLAVGAWLTLQGVLSIGAMVAATFLVSRVLIPVEKVLTALPDIAEARQNWVQLNRVLAGWTEDPQDGFAEPGNPRNRLSLANVAVRSPETGALILKGVSVDIEPGQMIQIVGPTGRGKTVLAETILGLRKRTGGSILADGRPLSRLTDADSERLFGYVPEHPGFVAGTLAENIAHLDPDPSPARVAAAARKACLHAMISALPAGYQTRIEATGAGLSRGQRHQLALARAVYHLPQILIFDEPDPSLTEGLPRTLAKVFDQMLDKGGAILILARKPLDLKQSAATYLLDDGRLRLLKSGANSAAPAPRIAVVPDLAKPVKTRPGPAVTQIKRG